MKIANMVILILGSSVFIGCVADKSLETKVATLTTKVESLENDLNKTRKELSEKVYYNEMATKIIIEDITPKKSTKPRIAKKAKAVVFFDDTDKNTPNNLYIVKTYMANARAYPTINSKIEAVFDKGKSVEISKRNGDWLYDQNRHVWLHESTLEKIDNTKTKQLLQENIQ